VGLLTAFFHNRNHYSADKTNLFTATFNKEVFASPVFFESLASVTNFRFFGAVL
jgi:hypothetical protein